MTKQYEIENCATGELFGPSSIAEVSRISGLANEEIEWAIEEFGYCQFNDEDGEEFAIFEKDGQ